MRFKYLTILRYSARGTSDNAKSSRSLIGKYKNGNIFQFEFLAKRLNELGLSDYFKNATLIPVPRCTPIVEGAVYPTKIMAETLLNKGIGSDFVEVIKRIKAIPRSSSRFHANTRNKVEDHLDSLIVTSSILEFPTLILVDDVLTLGRTTMACALLLKKAYPDKEIKVFCPFRTRGIDNNVLLDIKEGEMELINNDVKLPD